ncbi:hypothetical protein M405DRAFT_828853 [Rhizopogon salebrosus TDB-379]|nr:hypothetical protein M405DRAFT_828853 [Rhizopogon salebrosus TDB-379]
MTEYDYSPGAWERHMAQQARVSNWVSHTTAQAHAYANPFELSPSMRDRSFYDDPHGRSQHPPPNRPRAFNPPHTRQEEPHRHSSSRPSHERSQRSRSHSRSIENQSSSSSAHPRSAHSSSHTSSHKKLPSRSYTLQVIYPTPAPPLHLPRRHAEPHAYQKRSPPVRQHASPVYHYPGQSHRSHQRTTYLPPPPPGQSYIIPNGRLEYQYGPPAPKKPQPLFKRFLGFVSSGPGGGSYGPEKSHRSSRRRTSY